MYTLSKKYLSSALVLALLASLYFTLTAFAQEETEAKVEAGTSVSSETKITQQPEGEGLPTSEKRQNLEDRVELLQESRAEIQTSRTEAREERVEVRQEFRSERIEALKETQQKRVLNLSANISNRMEAAILRLEVIIERLNERITKLETVGIETATAAAKVSEASRMLIEAKSKLAGIDTTVYNATTSNDPRNDWENVKSIYREAASLIKASHGALREALVLLKEAIKVTAGNASAAVEASAEAEINQ